MNKNLVDNEKEFIELFKDLDIQDLEKFLDIEFAFAGGLYFSEMEDNPNFAELEKQWEDGNVDRTCFRSNRTYEKDFIPTHYPCVVIWAHDKSWDRMGDLLVRYIHFVYLEDFNINPDIIDTV